MKATDGHQATQGTAAVRRRLGLIVFVLFFALVIGGVYGYLNLVKNEVREIDATQLESVLIANVKTGLTVEPERQLWARIVDNFRSTNVTWKSARWDTLAEVTFLFQGGGSQVVKVYDTGKNPGRFRIGPVQYIGGDERMLIRMMDDEFDRQQRLEQGPGSQ